jgi:peptide/nickel transport system substrate-binding protein
MDTPEPSTRIRDLHRQIGEQRLTRRMVLKRTTALGLSAPVIAGLLAACGGDDDDTPDPTATTATSAPTATTGDSGGAQPTETMAGEEADATEEPDMDGDATEMPDDEAMAGQGRGVADLLRILYWQAPTNLNPHFSQGTKDSAAASLVLEPLIDVDGEGNLIPVLAAEVPSLENGGLAEDGTSVTYKLKEGVVWSDGTPFTAEDVRFTWEFTVDPAASTTTNAAYIPVTAVEVVDELTVTFQYANPAPAWFGVFATGFGGQVLPKHLLEDQMGAAARDAEFNLNPVGTGPYKVAEFRPGDVILFEINESYRDPDKPYFKTIEFKGGGDAVSAARAAVQTGETDWAWNLQVESTVLEEIEAGGDSGVVLYSDGTSSEQIYIQFADPRTEVDGARAEPTTQHPFLSDLRVRQAFALAADRDTIAAQFYGQGGVPTPNTLNAPPRLVSPNTTYEFDLEQAGALLDEAGWTLDGDVRKKDGEELSVLYQTSINPVRQKTQEVVKQSWEQLGAKVELKSIDSSVYFSSDAGNPDTASHFYADFEMFTNGPTVPYPILYYMATFKSDDPASDLAQQANEWSGTNYGRWVSEEYNDFWTQALIELDPDRQVELFHGMNDAVVNDVAVIPLVFRKGVIAHSNRLRGFDSIGNSPWTPDVRNIADWYFEDES